jgi:hypothetical protein
MRMSAAIAPPETPNTTASVAITAIGLRALEKIMPPPIGFFSIPANERYSDRHQNHRRVEPEQTFVRF